VPKLIHRGICHNRTTEDDPVSKREKAFADAWEEENRPRVHHPVSPEMPTLQALMVEDHKVIPISQDAATAVATIVQWLGSPIGWGYLGQMLGRAGYKIVSK